MKTGFKATYNFICRDQKFEIGQTYELPGTPIPCEYGFHYCVNPKNVLEYYSIKHNFRLLEVEDLGESITQEDKTVTNKIRIVREIPKEEYYPLFGVVNNELKLTRLCSSWEKQTFDENNNCIYCVNSYGYWSKRTYDEKNNLIRFEDSNDYYAIFSFDEKNHLIYQENSKGYWEKRIFDGNNNIICESGFKV